MNTPLNPAAVLTRLVEKTPEKPLTAAAAIVAQHRSLLRRAIRRGHSLAVISKELRISKRTLQRHLSEAGLFFRQPRVNKGTAIRAYKPRKKAVK
jgi:AraC-like DNA-binding protein